MNAEPNKQAASCAAILVGGTFECERCALAWDDGDRPPLCSTLTYARLKQAAEDEADRIRQSLDAIIEARPEQKFRNKEQLKKRMEFLALARLVDAKREADKGKAP